jgi:hypothetical protein
MCFGIEGQADRRKIIDFAQAVLAGERAQRLSAAAAGFDMWQTAKHTLTVASPERPPPAAPRTLEWIRLDAVRAGTLAAADETA